jgi:hypothetical protein
MMSLIARRRFALARWQWVSWMKAMIRICALHLGLPSGAPYFSKIDEAVDIEG